jgi:hypothetical protein
MSSAQHVATLVIWFLVLVHSSIHSAAQVTSAAQEPPSRAPRVSIETCKLGCSLVHIPSKTAGPEGLPVRISPPTKGRYPDGAPIAVQVTPISAVDEARVCLKDDGFVDVGFQSPGTGGKAGQTRT